MFPISSSLGPPLPPLTLSLAQEMVTVAETAHLSHRQALRAREDPRPTQHVFIRPLLEPGVDSNRTGTQLNGHQPRSALPCPPRPTSTGSLLLAGRPRPSHCERLPFVSLLSPQSLAPRGIFPFHLGMNRTSQRDESSVGRFTFQAS